MDDQQLDTVQTGIKDLSLNENNNVKEQGEANYVNSAGSGLIIHIILSILLFICTGIPLITAENYYLCGSSRSGHPFEIPKEATCFEPKIQTMQQIEIELWVRRTNLVKTI